jgi:hypothetical protein
MVLFISCKTDIYKAAVRFISGEKRMRTIFFESVCGLQFYIVSAGNWT